MKYDRLYNFISPITGKLPINQGYVLIGDKDGRSFASPVLIDVRQDIIDLRRKFSEFDQFKRVKHNLILIGNAGNELEGKLNIDFINLPPLVEAVFFDFTNPENTDDLRIPNPVFNSSNAFDWLMSGPFLSQIYAAKYDISGTLTGVDKSSSLAITQARAVQIMKRFDNANFIVGSSTINFEWDNPQMDIIPESIKQLYGLGTTYSFTQAQSLGDLQTGLLKNTVNDDTGTLSTAISGEDYVNTADSPVGNLVVLNPLYPAYGSKLISPISSLSNRKNKNNEYYPIADTVDIISGEVAEFSKVAVRDLTEGILIKTGPLGELIAASPNVDYLTHIEVEGTIREIKVAEDLNNSPQRITISLDDNVKLPGAWVQLPASSGKDNYLENANIMLRYNPQL